MTPAYMDYARNKFNYGSWSDAFFMPRPCMLKYNGTVAYYLDENDYTKKTDGTDSDVVNADFEGNAMMEWGRGDRKIWYKIVPDRNDPYSASIYIADEQIDNDYHAYSFINNKGKYVDHFYTSIYNGSLVDGKLRSIADQSIMWSETPSSEIDYAKANGDGWMTEVFGDVELINILLILIGKSLDTQSVFGLGNVRGYIDDLSQKYGMNNPGDMNDKGLFWGKNISSTTDNSGVKVFGMENYWGNQWRRTAGYILDGTNGIKIKRCYGSDDGSTTFDYNITGEGYVATGIIPSGTSGGYISKIDYSKNVMGFSIVDGSATTYYGDRLWFNTNQVDYMSRGGYCSYELYCGAFCVSLSDSTSFTRWTTGAALSYR